MFLLKQINKILNLLHRLMYTCHASSKHKAFRALLLPVLDYATTVWNPHTRIKNIIALEKRKFRIMVLVGFVEADSIPILLHGQSLPVIVVMSFTGHHFPPVKSIYL